MTEQTRALTERQLRGSLSEAMAYVAYALYAAAGTVFVGATLVWLNSASEDYPGRYWFAIAPLVLAGAVLHAGSASMRQED